MPLPPAPVASPRSPRSPRSSPEKPPPAPPLPPPRAAPPPPPPPPPRGKKVLSKDQAATKLESCMRGKLARKRIKDAEETDGKAAQVLTHYRVWDEIDGAARGWGRRGRRGSVVRKEQFGNAALSLSDSRPCDSIWGIQWEEAKNFKRSDGGRSSGVYFVQLPGNQLVVVKPDDEVVADYCGYLLAAYFQVDHPEMRVVSTQSDEGIAIKSALEKLDGEKPLSQRSSPPIAEVLAGVPSVLVMNFVKGRSLKGIAIQGLFDPAGRDAFCAKTFGAGGLSADGEKELRDIGRMMAFDILYTGLRLEPSTPITRSLLFTHLDPCRGSIFNYDRLPCVFQNGGNTENVMISDDGRVVAIDSMISGFNVSQPSARKQFDAFLARVGELVAAVTAAPETPHATFGAVRELLRKGRGDESSEAYCPPLEYDIGEAGVVEIQRGFLSCLADFDALPTSAFEKLPRLVQDFLGEDGFGAGRCDPNFLAEIRDVFCRRGALSPGAAGAASAAPLPFLGELVRYGDHELAFADGEGSLLHAGSASQHRAGKNVKREQREMHRRGGGSTRGLRFAVEPAGQLGGNGSMLASRSGHGL